MMLLVMLCSLLPLILITVNLILFKKENKTREKLSPFECGFDPKMTARMPFSIRFYMVAIIFLIFDIEITLILPVPILNYLKDLMMLTTLTIIFLIVLLVGLYFEWNQGALKWSD